MTFVQLQQLAKRRSRYVLAIFVLFVFVFTLLLVVGLSVPFLLIFDKFTVLQTVLSWKLFPPVFLLNFSVFACAAYYKYRELSEGGVAVARLLGGKRVYPSSRNETEKMVLNILDEMAVATGIPVPLLFVLPFERGINAFAAGNGLDDAVIGLTDGAIEHLSRDELQSVIAHEFSHILHGDTKLNMAVTGVLFGMEFFHHLGRWILDLGLPEESTGAGNSDFPLGRREREEGLLPALLALFALPIFFVGAFGHSVGYLLRAALNREREFLADSSAVQFTRNPEAVASALRKIGGLSSQGILQASEADQVSHFFFVQGIHSAFDRLLSSHPPLEDRIARFDRNFNGSYPEVTPLRDYDAFGEERGANTTILTGRGGFSGREFSFPLDMFFERFASSSGGCLLQAEKLLHSIPPLLLEEAHDPYGARAIILALGVDAGGEEHLRQIDVLISKGDPFVRRKFRSIHKMIENLDLAYHLPLVDIALPALSELSPDEVEHFLDVLAEMNRYQASKRPLDIAVHAILEGRLRKRYQKIETLGRGGRKHLDEIRHILQVFASYGHAENRDEAERAYRAGCEFLSIQAGEFHGASNSDLKERFFSALQALQTALPLQRELVAKACWRVAAFDGRIEREELELCRAVAESFGIPMPLITQ